MEQELTFSGEADISFKFADDGNLDIEIDNNGNVIYLEPYEVAALRAWLAGFGE